MDENEEPLHQTEEKRREKKTKKDLQVTIMHLKTFFFAACLVAASFSSSVATPANQKKE
jgi:hypothetical protein